MYVSRFLALIVFTLISCEAYAQVIEDDDTTVQRYATVELLNGQDFTGAVVSQTPEQLVLRIEGIGDINIPMGQVKSLVFVPQASVEGYYHNLQATRYFFGPNGFGLKKGEGYYQNIGVLVNQVSYGVTDYFTIGGGTVPLFLFAGTPSPFWLTPKVSIPVKKDLLSVGIGGLFGGVVGEEGSLFGLGYGAFTLGNRDHNLSVSVGYGMLDGRWSTDPVFTISGMTRLGRNFYLISENYLLPNVEASLLSVGGRSLFPKISMDYGLFFPLVEEIFIGVPWIGITVPFRTKN